MPFHGSIHLYSGQSWISVAEPHEVEIFLLAPLTLALSNLSLWSSSSSHLFIRGNSYFIPQSALETPLLLVWPQYNNNNNIICYPNFYNPRPPWNWDKIPRCCCCGWSVKGHTQEQILNSLWWCKGYFLKESSPNWHSLLERRSKRRGGGEPNPMSLVCSLYWTVLCVCLLVLGWGCGWWSPSAW